MRRERVGEICGIQIFQATALKISAETPLAPMPSANEIPLPSTSLYRVFQTFISKENIEGCRKAIPSIKIVCLGPISPNS